MIRAISDYEFLATIRALTREAGRPPTFIEISLATGCAVNPLWKRARRLREAGMLRPAPYKINRALVIDRDRTALPLRAEWPYQEAVTDCYRDQAGRVIWEYER